MPLKRLIGKLSWLSARWWIVVIAAAFCFAAWSHTARIAHVTHVSELAGGDELAIDPDSPTGYESGFRKLIVPERNADSFQWIMQVQEMFERGSWRLHQVDYDNAPDGRSVRTASLYRWWLGGIAWIDSAVFGNPIGLSVERAALIADPIVHLLLLLLTSVFLARYFNGWSAALFSLGFVAIFPLGAAFAPGQPDDSSLLLACAIWSLLPLLAGVSRATVGLNDRAPNVTRRLFFIGGFVGGLGLWIGAAGALPLLTGIAVAGACVGVYYSRKAAEAGRSEAPSLPWRLWALGGAVATLGAWLIDRSPALLEPASWQSDFAHPLYALAWWGCGEILEFLDSRRPAPLRRRVIFLSVAGLAIGGLAYANSFHGSVEGWSLDPVGARLTRLPINPGASGIGDWLAAQGASAMLVATLAPLAMLIAAIAILRRVKGSAAEAKGFALVLGPTVFAAGFAVVELGWWSQVDGLALVLASVAISSAQVSGLARWSCVGIVALASLMGLPFVASGLAEQTRNSVDPAELETLVERHVAQWLAQRSGSSGEVVLAPPNVTVSLAYFGGLRGLGTPYPENSDGFAVAVRLSAASTPDEARALASGRELSWVVHPSWDLFLEEYARLGTEHPENSFIALLNRWLPPRWLEPVTFHLPTIPGFEDERVVIFRTGEVQDNASAIARLVEYFLDTGRGGLALRAQEALDTNFADELVTRITAAEVALARGDRASFERSIDSIVQSIDAGGDFYLSWQFRVSMTLLLANANRVEAMKEQLERCLAEADRDSASRLSALSLGKLLHLAKAVGMEFSDPEVKAYALTLLPSELQAQLAE